MFVSCMPEIRINPADLIGGMLLVLWSAALVRALAIRLRAGKSRAPASWGFPRLEASRPAAVIALVLSALMFFDCSSCRLSGGAISLIYSTEQLFLEDAPKTLFTETLWLTIYTLPVYVMGTVLAGILSRAIATERLRTPRTMAGAALLGSLLPVCSCGAAPLARALAMGGRLRAALVFLFVAPVLSPTVIIMSWAVLGWKYLAWRAGSILALAFVAAPILARWSAPDTTAPEFNAKLGCIGCAPREGNPVKGSWLLEGWRLALDLHPYILIGIVLGAAASAYVPYELVTKYISHPYLGLLAAVGLGTPLYVCSGAEIPFLQPLMDMDLPMGHAIAFTISGNAFCFTSYFMLLPLFGKRVAIGMLLSIVLGSYLIGMIINVLT